MYENLNESKLMSNIELNNKIRSETFSKNANKGTAPKASDIQLFPEELEEIKDKSSQSTCCLLIWTPIKILL